MKFCKQCDNLLIPRNGKLFCKVCDEEVNDIEGLEEYRIVKNLSHEDDPSPIVLNYSFSEIKISSDDRKAYEELFE